jgi:hypothetical protein
VVEATEEEAATKEEEEEEATEEEAAINAFPPSVVGICLIA